MKFKTRKEGFYQMLMLFFCLFVIGTLIIGFRSDIFLSDILVIMGSFVLIVALMSLLVAYTYYRIENGFFFYRSGFLNGKIAIERIREIVVGKTLWAGNKPAMASKGLIIKYDKYEELYISPYTNEQFVTEILKHKPNIKIVRY